MKVNWNISTKHLNPTRKQKETLEFIRDFIFINGYNPTLQQIADNFKITVESVYQRLWYLEKKGFLENIKYKTGGWIPTRKYTYLKGE